MFINRFLNGTAYFKRPDDEAGSPEDRGGSETAPVVDVEEAAVQAQAALKEADEAKAREQAELELEVNPEKKPDDSWKDKELKKKHAQIKERDRELEAAKQRIKDLEESSRRPAEDPPRDTENGRFVAAQQITREDDIKTEAARIVAADKFANDCKVAEDKGHEIYKEDFTKAVENLQLKGGFDEATLRGILATDDPSKVLYELGRNPSEYDRIMSLTPERRIAEMTKLSMIQAPKPKVSDAPAPTEPVGGRGGSVDGDLRDDKTDAEWFAIRDRQAREAWARKNGRAA